MQPAMKNILVEIPRSGATIQFVLRAGASSGQAVIVASDDVDIRLTESSSEVAALPISSPSAKKGAAPEARGPVYDLEVILKRLRKLKVTKRATAINSIEAMFQFDAPVTEESATQLLEKLRKRGSLTIDASDRITFAP
jgi:hypothetical protein